MQMTRGILVILHRWIGLLTAGFLIVSGLTGSLLAFNHELDEFFKHEFTPQMYAKPRPGEPRLDIGTLWERAAPQIQYARVTGVELGEERAKVIISPDVDAATGKPYELGFTRIYVDPWTGADLGRATRSDISDGMSNFMPFVYKLHKALLLDETGKLILGIIAVTWSIDCFVGFYLTFPVSRSSFWRKWKIAWLIKRGAGAYRFNFDLHRASGLWLWPMLLIFAWSSVMFNMKPVYEWTMSKLMSSHSAIEDMKEAMKKTMEPPGGMTKPVPTISPRAALESAHKIAVDRAKVQGREAPEPKALTYLDRGVYLYTAQKGGVVLIDGDTGTSVDVPPMLKNPAIKLSTRDVVDTLLLSLHEARLFGLPYKILVCFLGLAVAMLSATGVYIWWRKRTARRIREDRTGQVELEREAAMSE